MGAHLYCPAAFCWAVSEGRLSFLVVHSTLLHSAYFLFLLSLLSRTKNASSSVQNGKYQRKITRPSQCPRAGSFRVLFPSLLSLFYADRRLCFPSHDSSQFMTSRLFVQKHNIWSRIFLPSSLPPPFPLPGVLITHMSPLSRLDGGQIKMPGLGKCGSKSYCCWS